MKKVGLILTAFLWIGLSQTTLSQERKEVKKEVKSVKKQIRYEENNGEKVLTIVTDENGTKTEEVYKGKDAEAKMNELNISTDPSSPNVKVVERKEVVIRDTDNEKKVTVKTNTNGTKTEQVFVGSEADKQITKLESETGEDLSNGKSKKMKVKKRKKAKAKLIEKN